MFQKQLNAEKEFEPIVLTEAELLALARYWTEVLWDRSFNHLCEALSDLAVETSYTTQGDLKHCSAVFKMISTREDMKQGNERLAEIKTLLGEGKAADVSYQVLKEVPTLRWFLLTLEVKTREEVNALLTAYREEKLKDEQTSRRGYVRCLDLERALQGPYEKCVKAQAARAMEYEYDEFKFDFGFVHRIYCEWGGFEFMTDHWDRSRIEGVLESVREEFREKDPRGWEIFTNGDSAERSALKEQYSLHFQGETCGCPEGSDHLLDWAWIDEEIALHRRGHCRIEMMTTNRIDWDSFDWKSRGKLQKGSNQDHV
jgi:hypothetical protein